MSLVNNKPALRKSRHLENLCHFLGQRTRPILLQIFRLDSCKVQRENPAYAAVCQSPVTPVKYETCDPEDFVALEMLCPGHSVGKSPIYHVP
jgi:hypothetical protein